MRPVMRMRLDVFLATDDDLRLRLSVSIYHLHHYSISDDVSVENDLTLCISLCKLGKVSKVIGYSHWQPVILVMVSVRRNSVPG